MPSMSVHPARSHLQQLREQLAHEEVTPRAAAEEALSCANSNASRNVYVALDPRTLRQEAATLPPRFAQNRQTASLRRSRFD